MTRFRLANTGTIRSVDHTDGTWTDVRERANEILRSSWREPGFCVPNQDVYPHQWLWDSCFHAVVWARLGSDRGAIEVGSALSAAASDGFVPHMIYWHHPELHREFWGRPEASVITQPPMYGHALAVIVGHGFDVPDDVVARARSGILHLGRRRRTEAGLIPVFHPWETGCDDSPRWDGYFGDVGPESEVDPEIRRRVKGELVQALVRSDEGHGVGSSRFAVGSIGFNALVAWNALELAAVFPQDHDPLIELAEELVAAIKARWDGETWVDDPGPGSHSGSGAAVRTLDTMAALLVDPRPHGFHALIDPQAFGARYGPRGVHGDEPSYRPDRYWRGSSWPQLSYLMMEAARRAGHESADALAVSLAEGAVASGWAEYWHPDTGQGYGAKPQTWATLAVTAQSSDDRGRG